LNQPTLECHLLTIPSGNVGALSGRVGLKWPTLTVIPWDGGKGGTKEASRRRTARKKGRLQLEFGIKTSQVVQVSPTGHKTDFFSEIGQLAQFEGRTLDLLGRRNMQNKAIFLFFQKKLEGI
jgi:hypothetical protein